MWVITIMQIVTDLFRGHTTGAKLHLIFRRDECIYRTESFIGTTYVYRRHFVIWDMLLCFKTSVTPIRLRSTIDGKLQTINAVRIRKRCDVKSESVFRLDKGYSLWFILSMVASLSGRLITSTEKAQKQPNNVSNCLVYGVIFIRQPNFCSVQRFAYLIVCCFRWDISFWLPLVTWCTSRRRDIVTAAATRRSR